MAGTDDTDQAASLALAARTAAAAAAAAADTDGPAGPAGGDGPVPLLFLISDTGGGHRRAAVAVREGLDRAYPGRFAVTLCDPLAGPGAAPVLRRVARLYGPVTRRAPWLWGAAYYLTNSRPAAALLGATLLRLADRPVARVAAARQPAVIVSFHPLTGGPALRCRPVRPAAARAGEAAQPGRRATAGPAVVTVVTDLGAAHAAWWHPGADLTIVPPAQAARLPPASRVAVGGRLAADSQVTAGDRRTARGRRTAGDRHTAGDRVTAGNQVTAGGRRAAGDRRTAGGRHMAGNRVVVAGPPVGQEFWAGAVTADERAALRRSLGLRADRVLVVLAGGGEGCGGIGRRARILLRRFADVQVVAVCGRNERLRRGLARRAGRAGGRLVVTGYTARLAMLLRAADLVVTKAGPGTIAEAACCGVPLLLTAQLPGQERGNAATVTSAGAGYRVRGVRRLVAEVGRLRADPAELAGLRSAAARLGRPGDTHDIARLIATLASPRLTTATAGALRAAGRIGGRHG